MNVRHAPSVDGDFGGADNGKGDMRFGADKGNKEVAVDESRSGDATVECSRPIRLCIAANFLDCQTHRPLAAIFGFRDKLLVKDESANGGLVHELSSLVAKIVVRSNTGPRLELQDRRLRLLALENLFKRDSGDVGIRKHLVDEIIRRLGCSVKLESRGGGSLMRSWWSQGGDYGRGNGCLRIGGRRWCSLKREGAVDVV